MNPYQNPTIFINNIRIDEPVTVFTDLIFCYVCFMAFVKTKHLAFSKAHNLYRWFFLLTGLSTLVAAIIGHAFLYHFGFKAKIYGWIFGILGISFAQFAALEHTKPTLNKQTHNLLFWICCIEVIVAIALTFVFWSFAMVEIHSAFGLVFVVSILEYLHYKKTKSVLSKNMILGVGVAVLAVLCHVLKLAISKWFNHMDLSHLFMAASIYVMYLGVKNNEPITEYNNSITT